MTTPITIDQITAAVDDPDWFTVDAQICELVGLDREHFVSWMAANDWYPIDQAAGNLHWFHGPTGQDIWLDGLAVYAASTFIDAIKGRVHSRHCSMRGDDKRPDLAILREIVECEVSDEGRAIIDAWDGGGTFVVRVCSSDDGGCDGTGWQTRTSEACAHCGGSDR